MKVKLNTIAATVKQSNERDEIVLLKFKISERKAVTGTNIAQALQFLAVDLSPPWRRLLFWFPSHRP